MFDINYLRSFRLFNFAIIDFVATFAVLALVGPLLSWLFRKLGIIIPLWSWLLWAVPLAILAHELFSITTPLNTMFFDPSGGYIVKIVIIAMIVGGAMGVSFVK